MPEHPLQPALHRSARALRTVTDLIEIAKARKAKDGRSDARQASLYRAIVAASVGSVEEATEALVVEALRSVGIPASGMAMLETTVAKVMQNPNSSEIRRVMTAFLGYDPVPDLKIKVRTSAPARRSPSTVGTRTSYNLWTVYNQDRSWAASDAAQVLDRFVKIRHSFAHQDSSVVLLTKSETVLMRDRLSTQRAATPDEVSMVEKLTATCAVRVWDAVAVGQDPVRDWRLHETQAINALLTAAGIVASLADGLANFLDASGAVSRSAFNPLLLAVEEGDWIALAGPTLSMSPCAVGWQITKYAPNSRIR